MNTIIRKQIALIASVVLMLMGLTAFRTSAQEKNNNFSLDPYYQIMDTIDRHGGDPYIRIQWMDTIIALRIPLSDAYMKKSMGKFRELYQKKGEIFDSIGYKTMHAVGTQNCHSYALEQYLKSKDVQGNSIFTASHSLFNGEMAKVLAVSFKPVQRFTNKEMKKNQNTLPPKTLLVFKDKNETPIHSVFYDQGFHSKNGALISQTFEDINPLLKLYTDTVWVDLYEINSSKFTTIKN